MSAKRKSNGGERPLKKSKKNGKKKGDDLSDFEDDLFQSDLSNDEAAVNSSNEDGNEVDDLPTGEDSLRVQGPEHIGTLLVCGCFNWDLSGRKTVPKGCKNVNLGKNIYSPSRFSSLNNIRVRVVVSGCNSSHNIIITEDWKAMTFGRNERGQLGTGDSLRRDAPILVEELKDLTIVGGATGRNHSLFLTDRGSVYACGDNKMGQCGVGSVAQTIEKASRVRYKGPPIVKVGCGAEFSMILDCKGALYAFGSPEYGQLGQNTNGEYIAQASKLSYHFEKAPKRIVQFVDKSRDHIVPIENVDILDFACGTNHSVAFDSRKRVFTWGFGGYGRLGHSETKDEYVPRLVKALEALGKGIKAVYCGSSFTLCTNEYKTCFLFGQTKKTGEANMYPKPIQELYGWNIRSIGCGVTSVVVAADNSVISFGPSPCFGELGHGELRKSTTTPMEVRALEGIYIEQVASGMHHTLMIARDSTDDEKKKIADLEEYQVPA